MVDFVQKSLGSYISPLTRVIGWTPQMLAYCTMHTSNLGICQWLNCGILLGLLERSAFGDVSEQLAERLRKTTMDFKEYCRRHHIAESQPLITKGQLHISSTEPPELTLKAYHSRLFVVFLSAKTHEMLQMDRFQEDKELLLFHSAARTLSQWHSKLERCCLASFVDFFCIFSVLI